ncbi:MAG: hypothetical protein CO113_12950 [Elusimicrobia bacterium CG_4_9_14_3_um_filter_62_55]|nr:MAG: hypothetical protein COR54_19140 [Elusimicrobia bacterium CG22_combo_CG10-13_8_21_14_all_63_91]PJA14227.1 MAG: hypothetical protein COX66_12915 [Elusimicrobia bacterium CG_4_10_14_0_2_um_filter_63_34]PJB24606.1 MAG: hypothetical protein CO113_12950 [Elusimicrobia bacterium CG_4_9_14_3_um_filter_62_55]
MQRGRIASAVAQGLLALLFCLWASGAARAQSGPAGFAAACVLALPALWFAFHAVRVGLGRSPAWGWGAKTAAAAVVLVAGMAVARAPRRGGDPLGALSAFRAAIGTSPPPRPSMLVPGRLSVLPRLHLAGTGHPATREVFFGRPSSVRDRGTWLYDNDESSPTFGTVVIDCTHTDPKGSAWSSY